MAGALEPVNISLGESFTQIPQVPLLENRVLGAPQDQRGRFNRCDVAGQRLQLTVRRVVRGGWNVRDELPDPVAFGSRLIRRAVGVCDLGRHGV